MGGCLLFFFFFWGGGGVTFLGGSVFVFVWSFDVFSVFSFAFVVLMVLLRGGLVAF